MSKILKREIADALRSEKWAEALPLLEEWCGLHPDHVPAWLNRGYCLVRLGRFQEAVTSLDRCLETRSVARKGAHVAAAHFQRFSHRMLLPPRWWSQRSSNVGRLPRSGTDGGPNRSLRLLPSTIAAPDGVRGWLEGSVVDGRYEVRSVARGGMAVVAIAFDRELRRMVAVKTPLPSVLASADGRVRFQREAESWIALGVHPNICCAYYLQEIGGMPRLFMEYVDGGDLGQWIEREKDRGPRTAARHRRSDRKRARVHPQLRVEGRRRS